ncbi:hypothetical protein KC364_g6775 [Hortaea werneckii]|nr:hypothetical protein KC350_g2624 [Hortaea werneckii]KAI7470784.1 hypothetical protein KC364_g6775 [Hortaea werneckii]
MSRSRTLSLLFVIISLFSILSLAAIDRKAVVQSFNPYRTSSSNSTPLQVGNGNFAFGADVSGLQTWLPYNTLSSWCWHNSSLPSIPKQTEPSDFTGLDWATHGRLVNYAQPNPAEAEISQWMIANPHRVNLGRVGLWFGDRDVWEEDVEDTEQALDLYTGVITSSFVWDGSDVRVTTMADPRSSTIAVELSSGKLADGALGMFLDYPYMTDKNKFEAPFVGLWNATSNHTTELLHRSHRRATIKHTMDDAIYYTTIHWNEDASLSGPVPNTHRYILSTRGCHKLSITVSYHDRPDAVDAAFYNVDGTGTHINTNVKQIRSASERYWQNFWEDGAFLDLTSSNNANATELQRRVVQSQYILAVNEAGFDPPQESGLVNNGWYGKFHSEMWLWHIGHWGRWGRWALQDRSVPGVYNRFLSTSLERARRQGYDGARWGKMSDPTGRSAPGEINSLLIWQQPHPMYFAELDYRSHPSNQTLEKWADILWHTAEFMASYAYWNESTGAYDLGPPMYPSSENTDPNATMNAAFELAYWKMGLSIAFEWQARQGKESPERWKHVAENLAPLRVQNETYVIFEGIEDMWTTEDYTEDHPSMLGFYGWLPPQPDQFNLTIMQNTRDKVYETWNFTYSFGWDFPLLSMNAARLGDVDQAVAWLLDEIFAFDDAGYHVGGARVPTPYMPGAASLLWAVALLAGGWDGSEGGHWPKGWNVKSEGFLPQL